MENKNSNANTVYTKTLLEDCDAVAYAFVNKEKAEVYPFKFPELKPDEIRANVLYAGLCLTDSHTVREHWRKVNYPLAPGHEIVAEVSQVGSDVKDFKVGEKVGFGTTRNSCAQCKQCKVDNESICDGIPREERGTYGKYWGGYATQIQHPAKFYYHLPENFDLKKGAPLLCAGITVYKPIKKHARAGDKCAVIGIGGLGHLAVKILAKMGFDVTGVTTSDDKTEFIKQFGAKDVLNINNSEQLKKHQNQYDFIINTVPASEDLEKFLSLCAGAARFVQVGVPEGSKRFDIPFFSFVLRDIEIIGSLTGGRKVTQEMIDFCAKNDIYPMVEEFSFEDFGKAVEKLEHGRPKFRCVVDVGTYAKKQNLFK